MLDQFDRLKKRNAFIEQYKKEKVFENGLEEFDDARATCEELLKEYKACESPDYISFVSSGLPLFASDEFFNLVLIGWTGWRRFMIQGTMGLYDVFRFAVLYLVLLLSLLLSYYPFVLLEATLSRRNESTRPSSHQTVH